MDIKITTNNKPCTVAFDFESTNANDLAILVVNPDKPNTIYVNSNIIVNGSGKFFVRLPTSPRNLLIRLTSNNPTEIKEHYTIFPLNQKLSAFDYLNPKIISFIKFAQQLSENVGILSAGNRSIYYSDDALYRVDLVDLIKDKDNNILTTPAAAGTITKKISLAKTVIINLVVTARMAFLLHEFAHVCLNKDIDNEEEADLNALKILLGLGYSRKEILHAFMLIFSNSEKKNGKSDGNRKRADLIADFIVKFENVNSPNYAYYYDGEK